VFDPAVLEAFVREAGPEAAAQAVDRFIATHARRLAAIRVNAADERGPQDGVPDPEADLAGDAARLGLMRAARAALTVSATHSAKDIDTLAAALRHGADELRYWRPSLPG
jgi:hypothetical protein